MNRVGVIGCGWLGYPLFLKLNREGHRTFGTYRTTIKAGDASLIPWSGENELPEELAKNIRQADTLVVTIPPQRQLDMPANLVFHQQIARRLSEINEDVHIIYTSSTSVYGQHTGLCTERECDASTRAYGIEKAYLRFFENATILRFGGLIGPNRHPARFYTTDASIPQPDGCINMTHLEDALKSIVHLMHLCTPGIYNVVSPNHCTRRQFYTQAFENVGLKVPPFVEETEPGKKIISDKIVKLLGYSFLFPDILKAFESKMEG